MNGNCQSECKLHYGFTKMYNGISNMCTTPRQIPGDPGSWVKIPGDAQPAGQADGGADVQSAPPPAAVPPSDSKLEEYDGKN